MLHGMATLADRCLRVEHRSTWQHVALFISLLVIYLVICITSLFAMLNDAPGFVLFSSLVYLDLFLIVALMLGLFCSSITEEKEELTLGLLRMAGISPLALLLGKTTPRMVSALVLLASQLPFVMLAVTLGGVSVPQILSAFATLGSFLLLTAGLGTLCSVAARTSQTASVMAVSLLLAYAILPALGAAATTGMPKLYAFFSYWSKTNPLHRTAAILSTGREQSIVNIQTVSNLIGALLLGGLAWWLFDLFAQYEPTPRPARFSRRRNSASDRPSARVWRPVGRCWSRALVWKDFYFMAGGWPIFCGLPLLALLLSAMFDGGETIVASIYFTTLLLTALQLALLASRFLSQERKDQTLSSLLVLPMPLERILLHKMIGCLFVATPGMVIVAAGIVWTIRESQFDSWAGLFWCIGLAQFVCFLHLAAWLSLYLRWGALPLAFVLYYTGFTMMQLFSMFVFIPWQMSMGSNSSNPFYVIQSVVSILCALAGTIGLQFMIVRRARFLASQ